MNAVLQVENAVVRHGAVVAVDGVSFEIQPGEIVALVGANGAGKTSLISAVAGSAALAAGDIRLQGRTLAGLPAWRRARLGIGLCPEARRVFPGLSVRENLIAGGSGATELERRIDEAFSLFPALRENALLPAWQLSGGQQQMLAVARALMRWPLLTLLDEPTLGLAPGVARDVLAAMRRVASGPRAVVIADQNAAMVLPLADRGILLRHGRVVAQGKSADLLNAAELADSLLGA